MVFDVKSMGRFFSGYMKRCGNRVWRVLYANYTKMQLFLKDRLFDMSYLLKKS